MVEKKVVAGEHTLDELVQYAMSSYNLIEINSTERKYIEQRKNLKESLILQHKPDVLGEMKNIPKPDISNEGSVREYLCKIKTRSEMIAEILWNGIQAETVQCAFHKLNYREQTLLEQRNAICMTCGRVGSWMNRPTFEELAIMFEGSTASGAERAYKKALLHLAELLIADNAVHPIHLKQKSKKSRKKRIATAIYEYQVDHDGEWGVLSLNFESKTSEIVKLADWDTIKSNKYAKAAASYLLHCKNENLPKDIIIPFEN